MANATAITVTPLPFDTVTAKPTGDTLDTGSTAVTLGADVGGQACRVIFEITNLAAAALTVSILAGDNPPAVRAGVGALTSGTIAQNAVVLIGPLEAARFIQDDGKINVAFTPGGTISATVRCYKMAKG